MAGMFPSLNIDIARQIEKKKTNYLYVLEAFSPDFEANVLTRKAGW